MPQERYAIAYEADLEQFEHWDQNNCPAKLCFVQENWDIGQECFKAVAKRRTTSPNFQWVQKLSIVPVLKNNSPQLGVLFVAMCSYGCCGAGFLITLWTFEEEAEKVCKYWPEITVSNQGEYKLLHDTDDALDGTLVVAKVFCGEGEVKASPHHYRITIYQYDQADKRFEEISEYVTKTKYSSDEIKVISPEIENIKKMDCFRCSAAKSAGASPGPIRALKGRLIVAR
jgi:hypothetical protein